MPINAEYRGPGDLPEVIPVFPLTGALLLPRGQMPLNIFEPRYLEMVDDALRETGPETVATGDDAPKPGGDIITINARPCGLRGSPKVRGITHELPWTANNN